MNVPKCMICNKSKNIVVKDYVSPDFRYTYGKVLRYCYQCASKHYWKKESKVPEFSECSECKERFIPKFETQAICYDCFLNTPKGKRWQLNKKNEKIVDNHDNFDNHLESKKEGLSNIKQ